MIIRWPTERTKPSQFSFVTCLLAVIFIVLGMAMLGVGVWARMNDESFAVTAFVIGGGSVGLGVLTLLAWYVVHRATK
jgi:hypothetical protein